jgi:hypothetical protein
MVRFLVKVILKCDITYVLWRIVFKTHVTVHWYRYLMNKPWRLVIKVGYVAFGMRWKFRTGLELRRDETTTSVSQLNRHLRQCLQKISISLSSRPDRWQIGTQENDTRDTNPNVEAKAHSVDNFMDVVRVILCQKVTSVDAKHTLSNKVRFECPQNIL